MLKQDDVLLLTLGFKQYQCKSRTGKRGKKLIPSDTNWERHQTHLKRESLRKTNSFPGSRFSLVLFSVDQLPNCSFNLNVNCIQSLIYSASF